MSGALDRPVHVTLFPDLAATERESLFQPLREFAAMLRDSRAPSKAALRLFSMSSYDAKRSSKGALRHDANVRECFAVVGDYDGGTVPLVAAAVALQTAGIAALLVTTPSHTPERARWRVIAPLSDPLHRARANATGYQLADYGRLVARLAGIFPDGLAAESWALSQAWYVGTVEGAAAHRVLAIEAGDCIDARPDLDATARPKPAPAIRERARPSRAAPRPANPDQSDLIPDEALPLNVEAALTVLAEGEGSHAALVSLAGKLAAEDVPESTATAILTFAADQRAPEQRDANWKKMRGDIRRTVAWAVDKEAGTEAASAPQATASPRGNGAAPPPPPPPSVAPAAAPGSPPPQPASSLGRGLMRDRRPKYAGNLANVITALLERPELAGCVAFDEMAMGISLRRGLPGAPALPAPRAWDDNDTACLQDFLQGTVQMARVGKETVQQGAEHVARRHSFHPVRDYLEALTWDGVLRADDWLAKYLGIAASEYATTTGRMWLVGMVARIMRPGCKFDYMLILEGLQGTLKSQVCIALCGPWVSDQSLDIRHDARAASQHLRNKWLVEVSELAFFRQADIETLKAFVSRTHERYLPRYARNEVVEPRQCGFLGTTNQPTYLRDPTGNRRFWPHRTGTIDIRALIRDRDQVWAEVVAAYRKGEHWWPDEATEARLFQPEQAARYDADAWMEPIGSVLGQLQKRAKDKRDQGDRTARAATTLGQVWQAALPGFQGTPDLARFDRTAQIRVREILQFSGWKLGKRSHGQYWWEEPL